MPSKPLVDLLRQLKKAVEPNGFVDQAGIDAAWKEFSGEEDSREATAEVDQEQLNREANASGGTVDATPAAEDAAKDAGVDLAEVEGTGKDGKITKSDVENAS